MNPVLGSARYVHDNSEMVTLSSERLMEFCREYVPRESEHWLRKAPFELSALSETERLHFLLVFNSVNYSYWGDPKWTISWKGVEYDGAWGMIAALGRALSESRPVLDPSYLVRLSEVDLGHIFRGNVTIPLFSERLEAMREVGEVLEKRFDGSFDAAMDESGRDAVALVDLIVTAFPAFADRAVFLGREVIFNKRAQLLVSDIYHLFGGRGPGAMNGIGRLTAFADYKIPQVLRSRGLLVFSDELARRVDRMDPIPPESREEVEIRANTVMAVEALKENLLDNHPDITSADVNDHLWLMGQDKGNISHPYHRTRTTAY